MGTRYELQYLLVSILESANVYFQPPNNTKLVYPCIVYRWDREATKFADNQRYRGVKGYQVTVIDMNPDSEIPNKIAKLPMCMFDRFFTSDNLNHFVYNIFF